MSFDLRASDLAKLNSLTKYPSILTYHTLENGILSEEAMPFTGTVYATEKIDGTNARIICTPDGMYLLGSREELLYARGDLIGNPALGIVEALKAQAERLCRPDPEAIEVYYFEVYGGKVTAASKQYTGEQRVSFRLFDIARIPDHADLVERPAAEIAAWRDNGGQSFADEETLRRVAQEQGIELTPRIAEVDAAELPTGIDAMHQYLQQTIPQSRATLDSGGGGRPEGLVLRTADRSRIAKVRFEDYERTLKRRKR